MINYKVLFSGSKGNCVVIDDIMIDCGVAFKKIKEYLYDIKYLLITHIHSDHLNKATIRQIKKKFPRITIIGNYEVAQTIEVDMICNANFEVETEDYKFLPFECVHDVLCYGFTWEKGSQSIIYATDTNTLKHAPKKIYDYFFIESNYDEYKLEQALKSKKYKYDIHLGAQRHLSTKDAKTFFYINRRNIDSQLIELHKSERFY